MTEKEIWQALRDKGLTEFATAGIMGNFQAESAMRANNVEDRCPMSDEAYTIAADNGTIDFIYDAYGYGFPQFTYWSLKRGLLDYCRARQLSVGDAQAQIDYLAEVLQDKYSGTVDRLQNVTSPEEAAIIFLLEFERPANMGTSVQAYRGRLAREFYDKYADGNTEGKVDTLKDEISNAEISILQVLLNQHGYGLAVDGYIGTKTKSALIDFVDRLNKI